MAGRADDVPALDPHVPQWPGPRAVVRAGARPGRVAVVDSVHQPFVMDDTQYAVVSHHTVADRQVNDSLTLRPTTDDAHDAHGDPNKHN